MVSTGGLLSVPASLLSSPGLAKGLLFASSDLPCVPFLSGIPKRGLAFGVGTPAVGCSSSGWVPILERAERSGKLVISWSLRSLLDGLLRLETCVGLSLQGFAWLAGCEKVLGGAGATSASSLALPLLKACVFDVAFEDGFGLVDLTVSRAATRVAKASLVFTPRRGLCCAGPSCGLNLLVLQARAWCLNLRHFLHWFGNPK